LLVTPGDPAALAEAMRRMTHEAGLRARLSAGGFAYALFALNARIQSEKLEALLLSVADSQ
jgi:glycosyltransferase involved in cell wall biosynthesis